MFLLIPTSDFLQYALMAVNIATSTLQLGFFSYLIFGGGWINLIRSISFFLDKMLINFIAKFFDYFSQIIDGTIIVPHTVESITKNVYLFIALILLFKIITIIFRYLMNPEMVMDEKVGVHSLIKRIVIGMVLMLFMPTIFNTARSIEKHILEDRLIEKVILDKNSIETYNTMVQKASVGRIIGFSVFQGFWSYDDTKFGSSLVKWQYYIALMKFDPSNIDINDGGFGYINNFYYDYFPVLSTIALGYTLYMIIKLCLDVLVRGFKLAFLQIISPLTISDYMISNDKEGVFSKWLKTTISCFAMIFIRVLSVWFLIFVCMQMQMVPSECVENLTNEGVEVGEANETCSSSILFVSENGQVDNLLRAMIIIALLAFVQDMPKLLSQIFNLDLEQESSVTGMLNKVGGIGKMVGLAGLSFAGGMVGGAISGAKSGLGAYSNYKSGKKVNDAKRQDLTNKFNENKAKINNNSKLNDTQKKTALAALENKHKADMSKIDKDDMKLRRTASSQVRKATGGMAFGGLSAAAKKTSVGGSFIGGFSDASNNTQRNVDSVENRPSIFDQEDEALAKYAKEHEREEAEKQNMAYQEQMANDISTMVDNNIAGLGAVNGARNNDVGGNNYDFNNKNDLQRANRPNETEIQQTINDSVGMRDPMSGSAAADYISNSAFANMSDDAFNAYQRKLGVDEETLKAKEAVKPTGSPAPSSGSSAPTGSPAPGTGPRTTPKS